MNDRSDQPIQVQTKHKPGCQIKTLFFPRRLMLTETYLMLDGGHGYYMTCAHCGYVNTYRIPAGTDVPVPLDGVDIYGTPEHVEATII